VAYSWLDDLGGAVRSRIRRPEAGPMAAGAKISAP
jgi:hypothetical protein